MRPSPRILPTKIRLSANFSAVCLAICTVAVPLQAQKASRAAGGGSEAPPATGTSEGSSVPEPGPVGEPTKMRCIEAHQRTQQMQSARRYVEARDQAHICVSQSCPGPIVEDCARWLGDLDERVPSVTFEVLLDGRHDARATVVVDGEVVREWTQGEALRLNPGEHVFRFELPPLAPIGQTLVLTEGMRFRVVSAEFKTPPPPSPGDEVPAEPPMPALVYPLLIASGVSLAAFTGFALAGKSAQSNLEQTCAPRCTDDDLSSMRQRYLFADIALGVGAAALAGAAVLYFVRPEPAATKTPSVALAIVPGGGVVGLGRAF